MNLPQRSKIFSGIIGALLLLSGNLLINIVGQTTSYKMVAYGFLFSRTFTERTKEMKFA